MAFSYSSKRRCCAIERSAAGLSDRLFSVNFVQSCATDTSTHVSSSFKSMLESLRALSVNPSSLLNKQPKAIKSFVMQRRRQNIRNVHRRTLTTARFRRAELRSLICREDVRPCDQLSMEELGSTGVVTHSAAHSSFSETGPVGEGSSISGRLKEHICGRQSLER